MNTTKHTPGPWTYRKDDDSIIAPHEGLQVCQLNDGTNSQCEANAALIAAAPELLEALKGLADHAHQCAHFGAMDLLERADSAIEKAEGL